MPTIIDSLVVTLGLAPSKFKACQNEVKKGLDETRKNAVTERPLSLAASAPNYWRW